MKYMVAQAQSGSGPLLGRVTVTVTIDDYLVSCVWTTAFGQFISYYRVSEARRPRSGCEHSHSGIGG